MPAVHSRSALFKKTSSAACGALFLLVAGLVALVLAIAVVNLLNLLLARAVAKAREMAVRAALGASIWRLARGSMVEGALLAATGAALGIVVAQAIVAALTTTPGVTLPRMREIAVDWRVMVAIGIAAACAAVSVGLDSVAASASCPRL